MFDQGVMRRALVIWIYVRDISRRSHAFRHMGEHHVQGSVGEVEDGLHRKYTQCNAQHGHRDENERLPGAGVGIVGVLLALLPQVNAADEPEDITRSEDDSSGSENRHRIRPGILRASMKCSEQYPDLANETAQTG